MNVEKNMWLTFHLKLFNLVFMLGSSSYCTEMMWSLSCIEVGASFSTLFHLLYVQVGIYDYASFLWLPKLKYSLKRHQDTERSVATWLHGFESIGNDKTP